MTTEGGAVVVVVGDDVFGVEVGGVVDWGEFGEVVVEGEGGLVVAVGGEDVVEAEPFGATPGVVREFVEPATNELRFKVAALEWKENSPTKPATVPEMTIGARFICLSRS